MAIQTTPTENAAVRQLRRLNAAPQLRALVDRVVADAEREMIDLPANENTRVEFVRMRELRALLFGD